MNPFGVVANPRAGMPAASDLLSLGVGWTRSIVYTIGDIGALRLSVASDINLCVMLNNECADVGWDWSGWEAALRAIVAQYHDRVQAVECGNELDRFWAMNENDVPPSFGAGLVNRAKAILAPAGIKTLLAPVAGPKWQEWMQQAIAMCDPDGVAFHPYGQRPDGFKAPGWGFGDLRPAIARAYAIGQRPVWLTEFGVKISDAGGVDGQADYARTAVQTIAAMGESVVPMACYFALSDQVGTGSEQGNDAFGLIAANGTMRPAYGAYQSATATVTPLPSPSPLPSPVPTPVPVVDVTLAPIDQAYAALWRAAVPDLPINPDAGLYKAWRAHHQEWGSPLTGEIPDVDGTVLMCFSVAGPMRWTGGGDVVAA